jgi:hypothetical protein
MTTIRGELMEYWVEPFKQKSTVLWMFVVGAILTLGLAACAPASTSPPSTPQPSTPVSNKETGVAETATRMLAEPGLAVRPTPTLATEEASTGDPLNHEALLDDVLYGRVSLEEAQAILEQISASGDTSFVVGLIDTLRYQRGLSEDIARALNELTGQDLPADWFEWVEWAGKHPEIESFPGYVGWKARLYSNIDPNFQRFLYPDVEIATGSRVEEIVWGGVSVDGIPALDNPKMVDPTEADYLVPHERIFGVSINGDTRAYPARFLDWHEMFNDVVGGEPVSLAY